MGGDGITISVLGGRRVQRSAEEGGGGSTGNIDGGDIKEMVRKR